MPSSISSHSHSPMVPARFSSQYFHTSLPLPRVLPRQLPRSIGPAGTKMAGRSMVIAPMSRAGVVLSQPHQHRAVYRVRAQELLGLHGEEVPVQHRRGFLERLGERHRGHLDRKPTGLPNATFDLLGPLPKVGVAGVYVAPGIDDSDNRLPAVVLRGVAHLLGPRAVAERAQIAHPVPPVAAQLFGQLLPVHVLLFTDRSCAKAAT